MRIRSSKQNPSLHLTSPTIFFFLVHDKKHFESNLPVLSLIPEVAKFIFFPFSAFMDNEL